MTTGTGIENGGVADTMMVMTEIGNVITAATDIDPETVTTTGGALPPGLGVGMTGKMRSATGNGGRIAAIHRLNPDWIPSVTNVAMIMTADIEIHFTWL